MIGRCHQKAGGIISHANNYLQYRTPKFMLKCMMVEVVEMVEIFSVYLVTDILERLGCGSTTCPMVGKTAKDCVSSFSWRYLDYREVKNDLCCTLDNQVVR
jgi:hypothetical protein